MYIYIYMYVYIYVYPIYIHTYIHTLHTYIHTDITYIHTYICLVLYDCIMYIIRRPLPSLGLGGAPGSTAGVPPNIFLPGPLPK